MECKQNICSICGTTTPISHYMKYTKTETGEIIMGGTIIHGPLCQQCWLDIGDQVYDKPKMLKKEHNEI